MAAVRLYAIIARRRRVAVVLRRGPSKLVQLLRWDLADDSFLRGQWLRGRVFERRCDLSPRGDYFVYFAAKHKGSIPTWTAVSKPPYFTALALWEGMGTWGGGGLFATDDHLELNHGPFHHKLAEGFSIRKGMRVSPLGNHAGKGEDDPILHIRMTRDGWRVAQRARREEKSYGAPTWIVFDPPGIYAKARPTQPHIEIEQRLLGIKQRNGPWYVEEHALVDRKRHTEENLGCEWADWDHQGDLLMARDGCLLRARMVRGVMQPPRTLIDLREERFSRVVAPERATQW